MAQKWWWENKFETLTKSIEAHEQSSSQQDRTMQRYVEDTFKLEDRIAELENAVDQQRASCVHIRLECSGLIRMLSFAVYRLYYSICREKLEIYGEGARSGTRLISQRGNDLALHASAGQPAHVQERMTTTECENIFARLDMNADGRISVMDFINGLRCHPDIAQRLQMPTSTHQENELRKIFEHSTGAMGSDFGKTIGLHEFISYYMPTRDSSPLQASCQPPARLQESRVVTTRRLVSETAALIAVVFSVWSCMLAYRRTQEVRCGAHGRRYRLLNKLRCVVRWRDFIKRERELAKSASVVARRRGISLARRFMRRWSGSYFTFSAFVKIRKCRMRHVTMRVVRGRLVRIWGAWQLQCQVRQHLSRSFHFVAKKACRQLAMRYVTSWYLISRANRKPHAADSMWLLDASGVEHQETCWRRPPDGEAVVIAERAGMLEQSTAALCLLTAREMELRDVREELHRRDESFTQLRAALAESESQFATMREELLSKMAVSELDESAALERVEALTLQAQNAENSARDMRNEVTRMSEVGEMLRRDLENARDQAADARRDLKDCKRDLLDAQRSVLEQQDLIEHLRLSTAGPVKGETLCEDALPDDSTCLAKQHSEALIVGQLAAECEALKGQLEARDVTERELRATLAQRLEGDAVMELRGQTHSLAISCLLPVHRLPSNLFAP